LVTGVRGAVEVAGRAREAVVADVPHTWTIGIGFAANLHVIAAVGSPWCEFPDEPPWTPAVRDFNLAEPIEVADGEVAPPDGPGIDVERDRDAVAAAAS
ncbi:MAG: enolase C-terminal domain-like protein, partial [Halobacteriales archaeon]